MKALLLGSIGVLAETSELQRRAYNTAFVAHGIDWHWNIATYCQHLATPGGQHRLRQLGGADDMDVIGYRNPFVFMGAKGLPKGQAQMLLDKRSQSKTVLRLDGKLVATAAGASTVAITNAASGEGTSFVKRGSASMTRQDAATSAVCQ